MTHRNLHHLSLLVLSCLMTACGTDAIHIHSQPEGAKLYVNSKFIGLTPQEVPYPWVGLGGQTSEVELVKDGYRTRQETITRAELIRRYGANEMEQGSRYGVGNTFDFTYPLEPVGSAAPPPAPIVRHLPPASPTPAPMNPESWR